MNSSEAIWKDVIGYENLYEVSNNGLVRSKKRKGSKGGIVKEKFNSHQRPCLYLYKENKPKFFYFHQLVAKAFIPNPDNLECVNHKDGDRKNNNVNNLEWITRQDNFKHSREVLGKKLEGEKAPVARFTNNEVKFLRFLKKSFPELNWTTISDYFGVHPNNMYSILSGRSYRCVKD